MLALSFGFPPEHAPPWLEKAGLENTRVLERDGELLGGLLYIPMAHWFGRRSVPAMGIAGVVVAPSARGEGLATELMRRAMRELHRQGVALSSLYPASIPLYRRTGYELAGASWRFSVQGRDLPSRKPELEVRSFEARDEAQVRAVYNAYARDRPGWLDRGPYVWERTRRVQDGMAAFGHVFVDGRRIDGYVFYRLKPTSDGFNVRVSDMAARTPAALRSVINFLGSHRSLADEVAWFGGIDDPWLQLFIDRQYKVRLHHHWMLRMVDIPVALAARGYPRDLVASLSIEVRDNVMRRQGGRYRIRVAGGEADVARGGRGGITLDVRTLAALYSGHMAPIQAAKLGLLSGPPAALAKAAAMFAGPVPSLPDMY